MVMFKARFQAAGEQPTASQDPAPGDSPPKVPPIEKERGPQAPIKLPGKAEPAERAG